MIEAVTVSTDFTDEILVAKLSDLVIYIHHPKKSGNLCVLYPIKVVQKIFSAVVITKTVKVTVFLNWIRSP